MKVIYNYAAGPEFADSLAALSASQLDVAVCPESEDARLFELLRDADVLWHCLRPVDARVIDAAPRLQLVQKIGVGVNTIDLEHARARNIAVCNMPGTNSRAVAEHTLGLMLAVLRQIRRFDGDTRSGDGWSWPERTSGPTRRDRRPHHRARRHGRHSANACADTDRNGCGRDLHGASCKASAAVRIRDARRAARRADIVSLHVPLTDATRHLLNARASRRCDAAAY